MSRYKDDGSVIPSSMPLSDYNDREHKMMFGIYRGIILDVVYPEDPNNTNGDRIEYVIKVKGQIYPNAVAVRDMGGVFNYRERIKKRVEASITSKLDKGTYDEMTDAEQVYVMFIAGDGVLPVIIGGSEHPRQYVAFSEADGDFDFQEFNDIEIGIDKDSNYTITNVGRKDPDGKILNTAGVDSQITFAGNGDVEFNPYGTTGIADVRIKLTKASKKVEIYAQNNKAILDSIGIIAQDKFGNKVELKSGVVNVSAVGNANVLASGDAKVQAGGKADIISGGKTTVSAGADCDVTASGDVTVTGGTIKLNGSSGKVLTTATEPLTDNITGAPTSGVATVKAG